MRWYSTDEICAILSRFDVLYIIGDSMVRHLTQAINILLREDLVSGARATWRTDRNGPGDLDCRCHTAIDHKECQLKGYAAIGTGMVMQHDPQSFKCKSNFAKVTCK